MSDKIKLLSIIDDTQRSVEMKRKTTTTIYSYGNEKSPSMRRKSNEWK